MSETFLHMGCDQFLAREAVEKTDGVRIVDSQHAGLKLETTSSEAQSRYFAMYYGLVEGRKQRVREFIGNPEVSIKDLLEKWDE